MSDEKTPIYDAVVLLAKGYDEKFVSICVGNLREEGIRTHLVSLKSKLVKSWHGIEIQADTLLRRWQSPAQLLIVPGTHECVAALAREPMVTKLVRSILAHDGWVAASSSADSLLKEHQKRLPANMTILPKELSEAHYVPQGHESNEAFSRSLIQQIRA